MSRIKLINNALAVIMLLATTSFVSIDCTGCLTLVNNYYQCKNTGATLNDAFYVTQNLNCLSLDGAVNFYAQIYKESDCSTTTCKCIAAGVKQTEFGDYGPFLSSNKALAGVKKIISDLGKDSESIQKKNSVSDAISKASGMATAVVAFCLKYEFFFASLNSTVLYTDLFDCVDTPDEAKLFGWKYSYLVNDDKYVDPSTPSKFTQKQAENYLTANALYYTSCSLVQQRIALTGVWSSTVPQTKVTSKSFASFFDNLAKRAKKNPPKVFDYARVLINSFKFSILTFDAKEDIEKLLDFTSAKDFNEMCFKSSSLIVECNFVWVTATMEFKISTINVTFLYGKKSSSVYTYLLDVIDQSFTDKSYIKSPIKNGTNLIYLEKNSTSTNLFEFNTNTYIYVSPSSFEFYAPTSLAHKASGLLTDGNFILI